MAFLEYRPTSTLFKYCSEEGFRGIIASKRIWLSDLANTNDPREIELGFKQFKDALADAILKNSKNYKKELLEEWAERMAHHHDNVRMYSSSFSLEGDSLPMWREYAGNYTGLAIGFRPTSIFGIPARIQRIQYADTRTADNFEQLVRQYSTPSDVSMGSDMIHLLGASAKARAAMTALKHESWAYEKEVRIVYSQTRSSPDLREHPVFSLTGLLPNGKWLEWVQPKVRIGVDGPVNYVEFPFGRYRNQSYEHKRSIASVVLGPKCPLVEDQVALLLQQNGFSDFEVRRSECRIR